MFMLLTCPIVNICCPFAHIFTVWLIMLRIGYGCCTMGAYELKLLP